MVLTQNYSRRISVYIMFVVVIIMKTEDKILLYIVVRNVQEETNFKEKKKQTFPSL